ncbi:MAG: histone deacetylase [Caldilineales bacterium]|nr:histone deacetylase [Caldilineales bacterium]
MRTWYAYDPIEQQHSLSGHPEHRGRLAAAMQLLHTDGILARLHPAAVTPISLERLLRVHPRAYVDQVAQIDRAGGGHLDPDTYIVPGSYAAALAAAGALTDLTAAVMQGRCRNAFSLMRPPGHHALAARGMGFCLFANVAIAARTACAEYGAARVLILDWDVHHGNGTEAIFYEDPTVAFISLHQYPFYPGTGAAGDTGSGPGQGYTLNVPLPAGVGDAGYLRAFDEVILPFAHRYQPDLLLVSAGFDAHWRDPLASQLLSLAGYAALTRRVMALAEELCQGRLVLALEGGYDLQVLAHALLNTLRLLHDPAAPISDPFGPASFAERDLSRHLHALRGLHRLVDPA